MKHACHALAIDDRRKTFHPVLFHPNLEEHQTLRQIWFMGMHTDVGGGYRGHELSDITLEWMVQHAVRHGLHIFRPTKREEPKCTPNPNGIMHNSRDKWWQRTIFKAKQREWDEKLFGKAAIHESVKLRTASIDNRVDGGYEPWILKHSPEIESWTHLGDWKTDPSLTDDTKKELEALEGWCAPQRERAGP